MSTRGSVVLSFRVRVDEREFLRRVAAEGGYPMRTLIRDAVSDLLDDLDPDAAEVWEQLQEGRARRRLLRRAGPVATRTDPTT